MLDGIANPFLEQVAGPVPITLRRLRDAGPSAIGQAVAVLQASHIRPDGSLARRYEQGRLFDELYDSVHARTAGQARFYVAQTAEGGRVVGVAGYRQAWCSAFGWELSYAGVHPDWQGRGIGQALIRIRLSGIRLEGSDGDFVIVRAARPETYRRMGFSPCMGDPNLLVGKVGALGEGV
ncbi:hypothetical protein TSH58p_07295 [Azospirillum sp. TSH58]|uniref:GNAT family N-acetyltransferase n=1 Tax=Azospirillum sp. TSH58 TaxID=664962 RepID=UPI000D5FE272|nr:GNAT family N-acetyltransferase [Azospirillum sp. TSH58]AWJ83350.1 hypothetical protein TSH58p_07295 [Azospirillum sp. TSH58]PWC73096.1 hypothetical protein TSH58_05245 [Azospirillum sp. TSH58]